MYKAAIIGAGSMGAIKPDKFDNKDSDNVLTIANAFYRNENIDLVGIVDEDFKKAITAGDKWNAKGYYSIASCLADYCISDINIFAICVNTENHLEVIEEVVKLKPELIMLEKPAGINYDECLKIKELAGDIPIAINYIRRYDKTVIEFKKAIDELGKIYNCTLRYGRGLKHDACHAIDLMRYFFGDVFFVEIIGSCIIDKDRDDISYSIRLACDLCQNIIFLPVDSRAYGVFDIDIYTEKGRFEFIKNGQILKINGITEDNTYGNYNILSFPDVYKKTELTTALSVLADNLVNFLDGKEKLYCTIEDALAVHEVYKQLGV